MAERENLLASIANTIKDYRAGEIAEPTPEHVDRWIKQFGDDVQVPMLHELDHVFKNTYISLADTRAFLAGAVANFSCDFWRAAHILSIQQDRGSSHAELLELFDEFYESGAAPTLSILVLQTVHLFISMTQFLPAIMSSMTLHKFFIKFLNKRSCMSL